MQRAAYLVVALITIVIIPSAFAEDVSFGTPAVIEGRAAVGNSTWLLIVTDEEMGAALGWSAASLQNFTRPADYEIVVPFVIGTANRGAPLLERNWTMGQNEVALSYGTKGVGHILVEAQAIHVQAAGHLQIYPGQGESVNGALPDRGYHNLLDRPTPGESVHVVSALARDVQVVAENVTYVQWSGARATCDTAHADCPTGGGGWESFNRTGVWMGGTYIEAAQTKHGTVSITTRAATFATGGRFLELDLNGTARFPDALAADCNCRRSLTTEGKVTLTNLRTEGDGLGADFGAMQGQVFRDEQVSNLLASEGVAFGLVAGVAGLGSLVAWNIAIWLLARDPLANPRRKRVFDHIQANPGIHFRGIADELGLHRGNLARHMLVLLASQAIVERRVKNTKRFYENHGIHDARWQQLALLRDVNASSVTEWIRGGAITQAALVACARENGMSRSGLQRRLHALQVARIVVRDGHGRRITYSISP